MAQSKSSSSLAPAFLSQRLDIGGENKLMPFLRECVEVMCADPQKYGVCGHRINQILPAQTVNVFDMSLLILDPVKPVAPPKPTME